MSTLGLAGVLTGGMVVSFEGLERGDYKQGIAPSFVHLAAALLTLVNFSQDGCMISVPLLLVVGVGMGAWGGRVWWQRTGLVTRRRTMTATTGVHSSGSVGGGRSPRTRSPRAVSMHAQ